jgi:hypothetical protein
MYSKITNEADFFSKSIGIKEMVDNYSFNELMAFFTYGKQLNEGFEYLIDNNLCSKYGFNKMQIISDSLILGMRLTLVEVAIERKSNCQVMVSSSLGCVQLIHNN